MTAIAITMNAGNIIAIAIIVLTVTISVAISLGLDRLARWKLAKRFRSLERLLDAGTATTWPGPEISGRFHGRQVSGLRRTELIAFTGRGGVNGKTIFQLSCSTPLQFTAFTLPQWPVMAELLQLGSPRVYTGDPGVDWKYGFAAPDSERFRSWIAQPEKRKAMVSLMSMMPPCRRQRFRVKAGGMLELNMPEYLFFKMNPEKVRLLFEELDRFASTLEQARG
jgi:hypothetical protein